jgi:23S rRNA (uracil1939-C5)-methyltransferase
MEELPAVKGVVENINTRVSNVVLGSNFSCVAGQGFIQEELFGKTFNVSPHSFFQVNTSQAENIYRKCLEMSELDSSKVLIDAYCGVGTFTLIASDYAKEVIGIECVEHAAINAKENALNNGVKNSRFITGLAEKVVKTLPAPDVVFLNPPRKGCDGALIETLLAVKPKTIVYMSCNPETLARDMALLGVKYQVKEVVPFDMFPQTTHVETVVKVELKTL